MKLFLSLILCLLVLSLRAQTQDIKNIRVIYQEVNKQIKDGDLYLDQLLINKNKKSYPAEGIYDRVFDFYYEAQNGEKKLYKIHSTTNYSTLNSYMEYLFNKSGKIIFIY